MAKTYAYITSQSSIVKIVDTSTNAIIGSVNVVGTDLRGVAVDNKIDTKKVDESGKSIYKEGFGFSIKRGDSQIKVGMSPAQSERLALYLSWALQRAFLSNHKEDVKYFEDNKKKSQESKAKEETPNNVAIPTPDGGVVEKTDSDVDF